MDIHPSNDLHTRKMEHDDDFENQLQNIQLFFSYVTYSLD